MKNCIKCGKEQLGRKKYYKYCSQDCYHKSKIGVSHQWGYKISLALKGVKKSPEHRQKVIDARKGKPVLKTRNENHQFWKGDNVGYDALHDWIKRRLIKPQECSKCFCTDRKLHLANISGEYRRDLLDWKYLCPVCHSKHDKGRGSIKTVFINTGRAYNH